MNNINRLELKIRAKEHLKDNYWQCLAACLLANFITQAFSMFIQLPTQLTSNTPELAQTQFYTHYLPYFGTTFIAILIGIIVLDLAISIFLTPPLIVGLKRFFIKSAEGETKISVIAEIFKSGNYLNVVKVSFMKNVFLTLWMLIGIIPYTAIITILAIGYPTVFIDYAAIIPFFAIILMIPYLIKYYSYFTVDYILAENPQISWKEAMARGKKMTKGITASIFTLQLSFLGWLLLGVLACGFGVIFVTPYIEATNAQLYLSLKTDKPENNFFEEF